MEFLLSHWHCILPAAGIIAALFLMKDKKQEEKNNYDTWHDARSIEENQKG